MEAVKIFNNFQQLLDYVPNCLICGKALPIIINGTDPVQKKQIKITFFLKNDLLVSTSKSPIFMDPKNNAILSEVSLSLISANCAKQCPTCDFRLRCDLSKNGNIFGPATLKEERMSFTMSGGKKVHIQNNYYSGWNKSMPSMSSNVNVSNRYLNKISFDFTQISSPSHLQKRMGTLLTFQ